MIVPKPVLLDHQLPAAPCTKEMREQIERVAKEHNVSIAYVLRSAVDIFLTTNDRIANKEDRKANN